MPKNQKMTVYWDGQRIAPLWAAATDDDWFVTVTFEIVDGEAMATGVEVKSWRTYRDSLPRPTPNKRPVTRDLFKRLPMGEIIDVARSRLSAWHEALGSEDSPALVQRLRDESDHGSPADWKYRLTAEVYKQVKADRGTSNVAQEVTRRLAQDHNIHADDGRVRKWIVQARKRGYLPPVQKKEKK